MSLEHEELPEEEVPLGWRQRIAGVAEAGLAAARTRLAILREEVAEKRAFLVKGIVGIAFAAGLGAGALLLLAAFLAALLAQLFGNVALGILGALVLYAVGAAVGVAIGLKALSRVRPFQFPAAGGELARDWKTLRDSWSPEAELGGEDATEAAGQPPGSGAREAALQSLEERYRAGAE